MPLTSATAPSGWRFEVGNPQRRTNVAMALPEWLRELAADAEALCFGLGRAVTSRLELGDLLRRELNLEVDGWESQLRLDALADEIARVVLAPYARGTHELASGLRSLVDDLAQILREAPATT